MNRRSFLRSACALSAGSLMPACLSAQDKTAGAADYKLRIEPINLEIAPKTIIKTVGYNGQVPGPMLRLREGKPVTIDVTNATTSPDLVHWHGLTIDSINDGAMEEGSPMISPGKVLRYSFTPRPAGTRWYHTHATAESDLSLGTYTGQYGFLLVEGSQEPAHYDQEINLAIHHWEPSLVPMGDMANPPAGMGSDVAYKYAPVNQHMLGAGEPIRVKQGQRVLLRLV